MGKWGFRQVLIENTAFLIYVSAEKIFCSDHAEQRTSLWERTVIRQTTLVSFSG